MGPETKTQIETEKSNTVWQARGGVKSRPGGHFN
nr:MAG TPA: hypothetical protein [Caudoviricetes sp.]